MATKLSVKQQMSRIRKMAREDGHDLCRYARSALHNPRFAAGAAALLLRDAEDVLVGDASMPEDPMWMRKSTSKLRRVAIRNWPTALPVEAKRVPWPQNGGYFCWTINVCGFEFYASTKADAQRLRADIMEAKNATR